MSLARKLADLLDNDGDVKLDKQRPAYAKPTNENINYISGLQSALNDKVDDIQVLTNVPSGALFTDTIYSHPTGAGNEHLPSTVSQTEAGYLDGVTSAIQTQINNKSATTHNHTGVYEPADATIVKDADIGVTVLSPTGDGSQLTGIDALPDQTGHVDQYLKSNGTTADWALITGGATGAGGDAIFVENERIMTTNYTLSTNKSASMVGPLTINTGITLTIPAGESLVIL